MVVTSENGCVDSFAIEVFRSADFPNLTTFTDTITCIDQMVDIGIIADQSNLNYLLTDPMGNTHSDSVVTTSIPGLYTISVVTVQGCSLTRQIDVQIDTIAPQIGINPADTLTCLRLNVDLSVQSNNTSESYL